jgi:membrane protease YdiL (CAAX protease family)
MPEASGGGIRMIASELETAASASMALLRRFPLTSYFIIALVFSWTVVLTVLLGHLPENFMAVVPITLGPTVAALVMTAVTEGWDGFRSLLGRFVLWRVSFVWYLFIFLGIPMVFILGTVFLPGAAASFDHLSATTWLSYLWKFPLVLVVGGPLFEESGWRGFALARLQVKWGPLVGTLILGFLWAAWHYPQYLMPGWAAQNGGFNARALAVFTLSVVLLTIVITWVFNNTRGSLLIAILLHASINTFSIYIGPMFPEQATSQVNLFVGFGGLALLIVLLTRGRLGYDRFVRDTGNRHV